MGQDTYARIGVATEIELTFKNLPLIIRVLERALHRSFDLIMNCYCHASECEDETEDFDCKVYDLMDHTGEFNPSRVIGYLMNIKSDKEFDIFLEKLDLSDDSLHFMINVVGAYARNRSRRERPSIFDFNEISITDLIDRFNLAKKIFIDLGIPPDQIKVGNIM